MVEIGDYHVDLIKRVVTRNGEFMPFSRTEWLLLQHLATNVGRVMTHAELLTEVWGPEYRDDLTYLRLWIGRLRRKLGVEPGHEGPIRTFQGLGYALDTEGVLERQHAQVYGFERAPIRGRAATTAAALPLCSGPGARYAPRRARDLRLSSLSLSPASAGDARARVGPNSRTGPSGDPGPRESRPCRPRRLLGDRRPSGRPPAPFRVLHFARSPCPPPVRSRPLPGSSIPEVSASAPVSRR